MNFKPREAAEFSLGDKEEGFTGCPLLQKSKQSQETRRNLGVVLKSTGFVEMCSQSH